MDVRVGLWRKLSAEELMLLNCGVGEDSWESLGLRGDPTSPSWRRPVLGVHWKDWCWGWNSNTLATSCRVDSLEKTVMLGGMGGRRRRGQQDEMAGWHHWLNGRESEWTLGVGDGQGGLACWDSWGHKESDTTERLNWTDHENVCYRCYHKTLFKQINFCPQRQTFLKSSKDIMHPWGVRLCLHTMCMLTQFREFFHLIQFTDSYSVLWGPSFISLETTSLNKSYSVSSNKKEIGAWWISLSTYLSTCLPIFLSMYHLSIINYVPIYFYRDLESQ